MRPSNLLIWLIVGLGFTTACSDLSVEPSTERHVDTSSKAASEIFLASDAQINGEKRYIIRLRPGITDVDRVIRRLAYHESIILRHVYRHTIVGFSAFIPDDRVAQILADLDVLTVRRVVSGQVATASWGLDRLDQSQLPLNSVYQPAYSGSGVRVYVVDSGIRSRHTAFDGKALTRNGGFDALRPSGHSYYSEDCYGGVEPGDLLGWSYHGTHVAATIGSSTFGVAPNVTNLVSVRVANCIGGYDDDDLAAGIDWLTGHALADPAVSAVANISLYRGEIGPSTLDVEDAIRSSIQNAGVVYVVAAGNDNTNACSASPARMSEVVTVGATDPSDSRGVFGDNGQYRSNYGTCVDIFAPGTNVVSAAAHINQDSTSTSYWEALSGTSMAAPHVAGVAAHVMQRYGKLPSAAVKDTILAWATLGELSSIDLGSGSPNRLAFTPRLLQASISGPQVVHDMQTYAWASSASGGAGTYIHEWSQRYVYSNGATDPWYTVGTQSNLQLSIPFGSPSFELRLQIRAGSQMETRNLHVTVICTDVCASRTPSGDESASMTGERGYAPK